MKIFTVIVILIFAVDVHATTKVTSGNTAASSLGLATTDTLYIRSAYTITWDLGGSSRHCQAIVDSGRIDWNVNARMNVGWISHPGGTDSLLTGDTITVANEGATDDFTVTGTGKFYALNGSGASAPHIIGRPGSGTGLPSILVSGVSAVFKADSAMIIGNVATYPYGGINFSSVTPTNAFLQYCTIDTGSVSYVNTNNAVIRGCTIKTYGATHRSIMFFGGGTDSVISCRLINNALGGNSLQAIYVANSTAPYIYGTMIQSFNEGTYTSSSSGIFLDGAVNDAHIENDTLIGFGQPLLTGAAGQLRGLVDKCYFHQGTQSHEAIILHDGDNDWVVRGCVLWGRGARSLITLYCASTPTNNFSAYYNTIIGSDTLGVSAAPIAFEHTSAGNLTYTGIKMVGNLLVGNNVGLSRAEMILGTTTSQTVTVNFSEFKDNAFDTVHYIGTSSANYPYSRLDSNLHDATSFLFYDSANGDFRLQSGSAMINAGDSAYFTQVFGSEHATDIPGDIGYYQTFTGGTGGGPGSGACCLPNGTCAEGTAAYCASLGGTYKGDGTSCATPGICPGTGPNQGSSPAPLSKQLRIASLCYYAPWWSGPNHFTPPGYVASMRDWAANRYSMLITTGGTSSDVTYMKSVNPNLKVLQYSLFGRHTTDTARLRAICDTLGLNFRDVVLHTGTADVTTHMPTFGSGYGTYQDVTTTADSSPVVFSYWRNTQRRVSLDPRKWQAGAVLWRILKQELDNGVGSSDDLDGIMLDEEQRWTGLFPGEAPILPTDGDTWASSIINPFTGISDAAFPDSQKSWRRYWAKTLGDSATAHGKIITPNGTATWGFHPGQADSGWKVEGRHAITQFRGGFINEGVGSYMCGSSGSGFQQSQVNVWKFQTQMAYQLRDSSVNLVLSYISVGPPNWSCGGWTRNRDGMMFLGVCLMSTFPTTNGSTVYFSPKWSSTYNDIIMSRSNTNFSCTTGSLPDTVWEWNPTWGKYFGDPSLVIDSSENASTNDPAGQNARIYKKSFARPDDGTPLTYVAMRYPAGGNWTPSATNVSTALPVGTWYELVSNVDDSASRGTGHQCFWRATPQSGGSTFTLANGQMRLFSTDTVLSNAGPSDTIITITGDAKIEGETLVATISRNRTLNNPDTIDIQTINGTAEAGGDYIGVLGWAVIPAGQLSTTVNVDVINDMLPEPNETIIFRISNARYSRIAISDATLTIIDNDQTQPSTGKQIHFRNWRRKG